MANYASCFLKQVEKEGYHGKNALVEGISKLIAKHWKPLLKSTEFSTGLGPVAKNATSHGENSGSPKESGRAKRACHRSLTGGAAFLFDSLICIFIFSSFLEPFLQTLLHLHWCNQTFLIIRAVLLTLQNNLLHLQILSALDQPKPGQLKLKLN